MGVLIHVSLPGISLSGVAEGTSLELSLAEYPFPDNPPGKVVGILASPEYEGDSVTLGNKTCTVTFGAGSPSNRLLSLSVTYDPS